MCHTVAAHGRGGQEQSLTVGSHCLLSIKSVHMIMKFSILGFVLHESQSSRRNKPHLLFQTPRNYCHVTLANPILISVTSLHGYYLADVQRKQAMFGIEQRAADKSTHSSLHCAKLVSPTQ